MEDSSSEEELTPEQIQELKAAKKAKKLLGKRAKEQPEATTDESG